VTHGLVLAAAHHVTTAQANLISRAIIVILAVAVLIWIAGKLKG